MLLRKRLLGAPAVQTAIAWLVARYVRLVHATSRWDYEGLEHLATLRDAGRPLIACFWHQRILMMRFLWREPAQFSVLVSPHRDGRQLARIMQRLDVRILLGSSHREGAAGLRAVIRTLKAGDCVGITPDGPRGPRRRAQPGMIGVARLSGRPLVAIGIAVERAWRLRSWDRFAIPKPFSRVRYAYSEPIWVPREGGSDADYLAQIQREMDRMTELAEAPARA